MSADLIRDSIERARKHLSHHPEESRAADQPATAVIEEGLRCHVEAPDGAVVRTDMPAALGGGGSAHSPGWLARAAHASCDATMIAMRAAELGIELRELEVTVASESDDRGLLGIADSVSAGPLSVRVCVRVAAEDAEPELLRELVDWAERHSPVGDAVRRAVPTLVEIEIAETATA
jgi:uncharacterized OsmC-like protein